MQKSQAIGSVSRNAGAIYHAFHALEHRGHAPRRIARRRWSAALRRVVRPSRRPGVRPVIGRTCAHPGLAQDEDLFVGGFHWPMRQEARHVEDRPCCAAQVFYPLYKTWSGSPAMRPKPPRCTVETVHCVPVPRPAPVIARTQACPRILFAWRLRIFVGRFFRSPECPPSMTPPRTLASCNNHARLPIASSRKAAA